MNDNAPPPREPARYVPIIGRVGDDGVVTITDPAWRPSPHPAPQLVEISRREVVVD